MREHFSWRDNYHADSEGNKVPVVVVIVCGERVCVFVFTCRTHVLVHFKGQREREKD